MFKIAVSAFIMRDGKLLILKRSDDEAFLPGVWEVPGGGIDEGETIEQGVIRETMEEASILVKPERIFGFFEYLDSHQQKTVNLNFICIMADPSEGVNTNSGEMKEFTWVTLQGLNDYQFTSEFMFFSCKEALEAAR